MAKPRKGLCYACEVAPAIDTHHIYPLEYGGADDGPKVDLCKNCHDEIHRLAGEVWEKRIPLAAISHRIKQKLVTAIHNQRMAFIQNGGVAPEARRRIVAQLSLAEQQDARLVKNHHGFGSLELMLKALIRNEAERIRRGAPPG